MTATIHQPFELAKPPTGQNNNPIWQVRVMAQDAIRHKRWIEAADYLTMLTAITPRDPWVRQWQVVVALELDQPQQAVDAGYAALQLLSSKQLNACADVYFNMGQALVKLDQLAAAILAYEKALAYNPALECARLARDHELNRFVNTEQNLTSPNAP